MVQDNGDFEGLGAGVYTVVASDSNGQQADITITLVDPLPITLEINTTDPSCLEAKDGTLMITEVNDLPGLEYTITGPSEASNTTGIFNNLGVGTYVIFAATSNSCQVVISTVISTDIECEEEEEFSILVTSQIDPSCAYTANGSFVIEAINGVEPFTFELVDISTQNTGEFEGLSGGVYTIVVTDQNGEQQQTTLTLNDPLPIDLNVELVDPSCIDSLDGSISVTELNNHNDLVYTLSGPVELNNTNGIFKNMSVGSYTIIVTNGEDCQTEMEIELSSNIQCEEENEDEFCPMTFSKVSIQINKVDNDLFDLIITHNAQKDLIKDMTYDQLYSIVEYHIAHRKIYLSELSSFRFQDYCDTIEKYRSADYANSNMQSLEGLDYIDVQEISRIQEMLLRIKMNECIKI